MRAHLDAGEHHRAIRQFQRLTRVLAEDLGVAPGPEAVALFERATDGVRPAALRDPVLVGRHAELAVAREVGRRASDGAVGVIYVRGEAGIGKSRYCESLLEDANLVGWTVLRGNGREGDGGPPYGPVREALARLLLDKPEVADLLTAPARETLARLVAPPVFTGPRADGPLGRQRILSAVDEAIDLLAGSVGLALFLDDLHAADEATLDLLHYVARTRHVGRFLLVPAARPAAPPSALERLRTSLLGHRLATEIALGPLSRAVSDDLVARLAGGDVAGHDGRAADRVWDLARGNPLFTVELAAAVGTGSAEVPESLYDFAEATVASLGAPVSQALRRAAAAVDEFTADEFTAVTGLDDTAAFAALDAALGAGLVSVGDGGYGFRHDLVREALLRTMPPHRRREVHREAATRLASAGAAPASVAQHWLSAGAGRTAVPWLARAAAEAMGVSAFADSVRFLDTALEHEPARAELAAMRADALFAMGDPGAVDAYLRAVAASAGQERDLLRVKLAYAYLSVGDVAGAQRALDGVNVTADASRIRQEVTVSLLAWFSGDLEAAGRAAEEAWRLALAAGTSADLVDATMVRAMVAHNLGSWPERLHTDVFDTRNAPELAALVCDAHLCIAEGYLYGGTPFASIRGFAEELRSVSRRVGAARGEAFATTLLGEAHLLAGQLAEAERELAEGVRLHRQLAAAGGVSLSLHRLAETSVAAGRTAGVRAALEESLEAARSSPLCQRHLLSRIYGTAIQAAPDAAAAIAVVDQAEVAVRGPAEACPFCGVTLLVPATIACARAGDLARAQAYLAAAEAVAGMLGPTSSWHVAVTEAAAHIAAAGGDIAFAVKLFARASGGYTRTGQLVDAARCAGARGVAPV